MLESYLWSGAYLKREAHGLRPRMNRLWGLLPN